MFYSNLGMDWLGFPVDESEKNYFKRRIAEFDISIKEIKV